MNGVFIGLGSNLAEPVEQITTAVKTLHNLPKTTLVRCSSLYSSPPMGPQDQPDYVNAVVELKSELSAHILLDELQSIEQKQGRVRLRHWGERTLDLDILLYGSETLDDERLQIPHPGIAERAFVLYPLAEIAAELIIPKQGKVDELLQHCPRDGLKKLDLIEAPFI